MKKTIIAILSFITISCSTSTMVFAKGELRNEQLNVMLNGSEVKDVLISSNITIMLNGEKFKTKDQTPVIIDGATYVPASAFAKNMGYSFFWNNVDHASTISNENTYIDFYEAQGQAKTNIGEVESLTPYFINGRMMVPIRTLATAFALNISWNADDNTLTVVE